MIIFFILMYDSYFSVCLGYGRNGLNFSLDEIEYDFVT
jgi:hypothetical protein